MKQIVRPISTVAALLGLLCLSSHAVITTISRQGCDIVLTGPSTPGQQFTVQFRDSLSPGSTWTTLTNGLPAATAGATTTFVHPNVLPDCGGQMRAQAAGGQTAQQLSPEERAERIAKRREEAEAMAKWLMAQLEEAVARARAQREEWAKHPESRPTAQAQPEGQAQMMESGSGCCGFYRVFQIPDWAFNITNFVYDGPTFFPVDFGNYLEWVDHTEVLLNGQVSADALFLPIVQGGVTNWGVGIYFDRMASGTYQIQLRCGVRLNDQAGDDAAYVVLSNRTASIVVANQVTFTDWIDDIQGSSYTFRAQTANPNTDWSIDIYDAWDQYVNGASGHTSNGQIAWTWDLRDIFGNLRDDLDNDPYLVSYITFDTSGAGAAAAAQTTRRMPQATPFPNIGNWMVSFQDRWFSDAPGYPADSQDHYNTGMDGVWSWPFIYDQEPHYWPLKFGTNVYSQAECNESWAGLKAWLGDPHIRNWYYYGHGGPYDMGCDRHTLDTNGLVNGSALTSNNSRSRLLSWEVWTQVKNSRYRFVFLDGCDTSLGNWPATFNISKQTNSLDFYQNHPKKPRPSAFVGWATKPGGEEWGTIKNYFLFRANWMGLWANTFGGKSLSEAIIQANLDKPWIDDGLLRRSIRVYGYTILEFTQFNYKNDWP